MRYVLRAKTGLAVCVLACVMAVVVGACERKGAGERESGGTGGQRQRVVLYTSMDAEVVKPIVEAFEKRAGIAVDLVTDTEATKTTGLVNRLMAERKRPRGHVWWNSEVVGTMQLFQAGVIEKPKELLHRPRVLAFSTRRGLEVPSAGVRLKEIVELSKKSGKIGIADPAFGTTRAHAAIWHSQGKIGELAGGGFVVYDGNSAVVRAISSGEVVAGITDFDDAQVGVRNGWGIGFVPILSEGSASEDLVLAIPGTVARIKPGEGGTWSKEIDQASEALIGFIMSDEVARQLEGFWVPRAGADEGGFVYDGKKFARYDWEGLSKGLGVSVPAARKALGRE